MDQIIGGAPADNGGGSPIKDATTASFGRDVIEASQQVPVIVDFWAPWCGPCKQLGPILEKAVAAAGGAVQLVKVNIDENPEIAQQLRIQSIPAVFAFAGGRPVDGFVGAVPESQIKAFVDRLIQAAGGQGGSPVAEALEHAQAALDQGDPSTAGAVYGQILQQEPENAKALAGMARCFLATGQPDSARDLIAKLSPALQENVEIAAVRSALDLAAEAEAAAGRIPELTERVARDANDHQARFDLALACYAQDDAERAIEGLLDIVRRNRGWNEDAARKQLVKIFDALGPNHPLTLSGRQQLSLVLFS